LYSDVKSIFIGRPVF